MGTIIFYCFAALLIVITAIVCIVLLVGTYLGLKNVRKKK